MRVIAGNNRGLILKTLVGDNTRPTKDMVREALFNILSGKVIDSVFLDLFAGSGAVGIEALSRGASKAYFCDNHRDAIDVVKSNVNKARLLEKSEVCFGDFRSVLGSLSRIRFDIIFVDPPYHQDLGVAAIKIISDKELLAVDGVIVYETDQFEVVPDVIGKYERYDYRKYGRNRLNFFKARSL